MSWRPFTEEERKYIYGVQVKYTVKDKLVKEAWMKWFMVSILILKTQYFFHH